MKLAGHLRRGQLVTLESTTYPGTTRDELAPILEAGSGLTAGVDFHLAFSPERVDPGRTDYTTKSTPKVVGGLTPACTARALEVYGPALDNVVPVSTPEVAEMTKLLENIFRSVNIALMNELAMLCDRMNIDVWEVIDAAATKPFGFMKFQPGPGLGGHCIPHRPVLPELEGARVRLLDGVHRARRQGQREHAVLLRREARTARSTRGRRASTAPSVLVLGVAYKADIDDLRESPGAQGHPPAARARRRRRLPRSVLRRSCPSSTSSPSTSTGTARSPRSTRVVIVTAHSALDYRTVVAAGRPRRRLPQRHGRHPERRQRLETVRGETQLVSEKVRVGVVGLGYWGPNLARNFDRLPGAELAYCCDLDEANLAKARSLYPSATITDDYDAAARRRRARRDRRRHLGAHALRPRQEGARGRQAHLHREAHRAQGRRRPGPPGHGRRVRRQAHGRPPARVPPGAWPR